MYLALFLSALALLIAVFSFFYFRSYLKRRTAAERILAELREEVNKILKSIDETTERDISLIEERENNLKNLLGEIDKRFKVYIRELEQKRTYEELGKNRYRISRMVDSSDQAEDAKPSPAAVSATMPAAMPAAKSPPAESPSAEPPPVKEMVPMAEQIRSLLNEGLSVPAIASRLDISIAEVELAVALRSKS